MENLVHSVAESMCSSELGEYVQLQGCLLLYTCLKSVVFESDIYGFTVSAPSSQKVEKRRKERERSKRKYSCIFTGLRYFVLKIQQCLLSLK